MSTHYWASLKVVGPACVVAAEETAADQAADVAATLNRILPFTKIVPWKDTWTLRSLALFLDVFIIHSDWKWIGNA